jgi:hypothetical protein
VLAAVLALAIAGQLVSAKAAQAQTSAEIQAARELFVAAMKDEQAARFADALQKFREVQKVKDTPQVRYRIATCLAGTGKLREARKTFAEITARPDNQEEKDVETAAKEQLSQLATKTPTLTVHLRSQPPIGAALKIDDAAATPGQPQDIDPGDHVVTLTGPGLKPSLLKVNVPESVRQVVELAVEQDAPSPPPPPPPAGNRSTYGIVGVSVGGALAVGSIVALVVRNGDIDTIKKDCPGNVCPTATRNEVTSAKSGASTAGVAAGIMGAGALIAGGAGAYFLLTPDKAQSTALGFAPSDRGGMMMLRGQF